VSVRVAAASTRGRHDRELQPVGVVVLVTALGVGFNLLRLALGLDRAPLLYSVLAFAALTVAAAGLALRLGMSREQLGLRRPDLLAVVLGGTMAVIVLAGAAWLTAPFILVPSAVQLASGLLLFGAGTAPAEELLFRGVLYGTIDRRGGPVLATGVSALAFALAHVPVYGWGSLGVAVCAGLLLGWLRWWSGSLVVPGLVHLLADLAILWL
jgi:membrane protease YdiL (CAAX protease family)